MKATLAVAALTVAGFGLGACEPTYVSCPHSGNVKATVIRPHSAPLPDVTSAEVRTQGDWRSVGWSPACAGSWVEGMHPSGGDWWSSCYWNPIVDGTGLANCTGDVVSRPDIWNRRAMVGWFTRSGGHHFQIWTDVFTSADRMFSGSCSVHGDGIAPGSRFQCTPTRLR